MRYFRVKYGYQTADRVTIPERDLEKALYAQLKGTPIQLGESVINGKHIISITPAYHKHTGWYEWYDPTTGEDWKQIERDCPDYTGSIDQAKERVLFLMRTKQDKLIGTGVELPQLEKPKAEMIEGVKQLADKMKI